MNHKSTLAVFMLILTTACSDQNEEVDSRQPSEQEVIEQEQGDEQLTEELSQKLLNATKIIGLEQESAQEALNKDNLEKLSEEDRQALIDLTMDEGAEKIKADTDKVLNDLEQKTRENVENR